MQSYLETLLEDMNGKSDFLIDAIVQMRDEMGDMAKQSDLNEVKADFKVIKTLIIDHEARISKLDTA